MNFSSVQKWIFLTLQLRNRKYFRQINDIIYLLIGVATFFDDMAYNSLTLQIKISIKFRFTKDSFCPNVCKNNTKHNESCKWYVKRWIIYVAFVQKDSHCKISSKFHRHNLVHIFIANFKEMCQFIMAINFWYSFE